MTRKDPTATTLTPGGDTDGDPVGDRAPGWLGGLALAGAGLASACCIVPLLFVTLGISGAWIGSLTALEPYKPYVGGFTLLLIALGFWHVHRREKPACAEGSYCARPQSQRTTKTILWAGLVLVLAALSIDWWAPLFV